MAVREQRKHDGHDQSPLDRGKAALQERGVIYVIYSWQSKKLYVGQTSNSAAERFKQHIQKSRIENTPLYRDIRRLGLHQFGVFPVEYIPPNLYESKRQTAAKRLERFRKVATEREQYWINRLHTGPGKGWNVQFAVHARKKKKGRNR